MIAEEQALADDRMRAEIAKLVAETAQISRERFWIPFMILAGVVIAVISIVPRLFGG